MKYYPRQIEQQLKQYLKSFPVVGLTGPRQSGKSTLLLHCLEDQYQYVTFDDQEHIDDFYDDPKRFMAQYSNKVIFDEVQKVPEIFNYVKLAVDKDRENYGKFVLTGSSQFSMLTKITESLAGRIGLLTLLPFEYNEIPERKRYESIYLSSYPELVTRSYDNHRAWYSSYLTTYLEKDVRQISDIGDIRDFKRFIQLLASNTSSLLNMSSFSNDLGVAVNTVKRWISILEASYIVFLLSPHHNNYGKRVIKSPKIYFYDTAFAAYLTKNDSKDHFENGPMTGALFENYIIAETKKKILHSNEQAELYFYRTSHGVEVDCIIDYVTHQDLIEIKFNSTFKPRMLEPVKSILTEENKGMLVYSGKSRDYSDQIKVLNYKTFLEKILVETKDPEK